MRIAHVTDCYVPRLGGIELQVRELARRQQADGHDVTVVTSVAAGQGVDDEDAAHGVTVLRPPPKRGRRRDGGIRYARSIAGCRTVLSGKFDMVHVHASTYSPLAYTVAQVASHKGFPTAMSVHSLWAYATPIFLATDRLWRWGSMPIAWSAVSAAATLPLLRVLRGRAPVDVVPNGVDVEQWAPAAEGSGEPPRRPSGVRLISVMRLARRKRPDQLLAMLREAGRRLPQHGPDAPVTAEIVGDGPRLRVLERYLERHDMSGWVTLSGRRTQDEVRAALRAADVFIAPATLESFGVAALEARTAGLPIIAHAGTGIADFITHGRDGLLANSDAEMTDAIVRLVECPAQRAQMRAHNRAEPPPATWDAVLAGYQRLYDTAAALQVASGRVSASPAIAR